MEVPVLTQSSLDDQLQKLRRLVVDLPGWLEEGQDDLRTNNSEAIVTAYQWAFRQTKQGEEQLQRNEDELEKILTILSKDKMRRYCKLRASEIREDVSSEVSGELAKLCRGLDRAEKQAQPKIHQLLEIIHECETALSLYRNHLKWVETVAWKHEISLPGEEPTESQIPPSEQKNPRGAGRGPDENVGRRRKLMFKKLNTRDLKEAKRRWHDLTVRHEIYQLLEMEGIKMIDSDRFQHYAKWTELSDEPVDDLFARDTLFTDLKRNWNQLLEEHKT